MADFGCEYIHKELFRICKQKRCSLQVQSNHWKRYEGLHNASERSLDINEEIDFEFAEFLYQVNNHINSETIIR